MTWIYHFLFIDWSNLITIRYQISAKRKYVWNSFSLQCFYFFKETLILKGMTGSLDKGIYKELSSFTGSLSGFTPKPSSPKQFPIKIKTKIENAGKTNPKWQMYYTPTKKMVESFLYCIALKPLFV